MILSGVIAASAGLLIGLRLRAGALLLASAGMVGLGIAAGMLTGGSLGGGFAGALGLVTLTQFGYLAGLALGKVWSRR